MSRHIVKIILALGLALLIYFIGLPGCSETHFGSLKTLSCEDFPESFNCKKVPIPDFQPANQDQADEDEEYEEYGRENERESDRESEPYSSDPLPRDPPVVKHYVDFDYDISLGMVDIVFVVDNSSSMAKEHRSIAKQLRSFLNQIRDVQYHIAVITTDISSSPDNPVRNAYYQDGRFISIGGRMFLTNESLGENPSKAVVADFKQAVTREETTRCDTRRQPKASGNKYDRFYEGESGAIECPSHDERGIYALNLAIENPAHRSFFRKGAHLMVIFLSDEDVRSSEDYINQTGFDHYALEDYDYPEILVQRVYELFGPTKSLSAHSIIIPPGDSQCLEEQNRRSDRGQGTGRGYYGKQ